MKSPSGAPSAVPASDATAPEDVVWLGDADARDPRAVGGKAAQLSRLYEVMPVPLGFCIPAEAVRRMASADGTIPRRGLQPWIAAGYEALEARLGRSKPRVAVRSSGLAEDGQTRSFAGQYLTVLGVSGQDEVLDAALRCCASLRSDRVARYQGGASDPEHDGMAVLVQELVEPDVSAVVFSADPVAGTTTEVLINASWGLGEAVVSGAVTPDTYRVSCADGAVVRREVADKDLMVVAGPAGTTTVDVPVDQRRVACLDDAQCRALADMAIMAEALMGWPVDLECAFRGEEHFLLQCRPITTL